MQRELALWKSKGQYFQYNGNSIFYILEGDGPALLILHGYPYNSYDFKYLLEKFAKQFQVIIPDMLGMGFSDKPSNHPYGFRDHADMYSALLEKLSIKNVHLLSHDLGNSVTQEILARNEEGVNPIAINSIAFLNGGLFTDVYKPRFIQILLSQSPKPIGKLISRLMGKKSIDKATAEVFGKHTKPGRELLQDFWDVLNYNKGKSLAWKIGRLVFEKEIHQTRWIEAMQKTKVHMCFINGPADPNSGIHMAKRYEELIPNPDVMLLPEHIGHWPQLEAPEEVIRFYFIFIGKHFKFTEPL